MARRNDHKTGKPKPSEERSSDRIRKDAAGQFAPSEGDRKNSGLASANPRVTSQDGRAPGHGWDERPGDPEAPGKHGKRD